MVGRSVKTEQNAWYSNGTQKSKDFEAITSIHKKDSMSFIRDNGRSRERRNTGSRRIPGSTADRPLTNTAILRRLEELRGSGRTSLDSHRRDTCERGDDES